MTALAWRLRCLASCVLLGGWPVCRFVLLLVLVLVVWVVLVCVFDCGDDSDCTVA